jgi:hypothetical protein
MTASKQHFEMIARVLRETPHQTMSRQALAEAFADELGATNERFDRERFLKACYVPDGYTYHTIASIERLNLSSNGNPRFRFQFGDGSSALSQSDAAFGYEVGNPGFRAGDRVGVKFSRAGRVEHMVRA